MEKKKKTTLTVSLKKPYNVSHYTQSKLKTSVVIEKKTPKRWGEKKFQSRDNNFIIVISSSMPSFNRK